MALFSTTRSAAKLDAIVRKAAVVGPLVVRMALAAVFDLFTARGEIAPLRVYPDALGRVDRATTTLDRFPYLLGALASEADRNGELVAAAKWQGGIATKKSGSGWWYQGSGKRDAWIHLRQYDLYDLGS